MPADLLTGPLIHFGYEIVSFRGEHQEWLPLCDKDDLEFPMLSLPLPETTQDTSVVTCRQCRKLIAET